MAVKASTIISIKDNNLIKVVFGLIKQLEIVFLIWIGIALSCLSQASFARPWRLLSCWPGQWFIVWSCLEPFLPFSCGTISTTTNYCCTCFTFPAIFHLHQITFHIEQRQFNSIFYLNFQEFTLLISPAQEVSHFPGHFWILFGLFYW